MKILHVIPSFSSSAGGSAYALKNIADSLREFEIEQVILAAGDSDINVEGVDVINFPYVNNLKAHHGFKGWLQDNVQNFDLVHIHSIWLFHSRVAAKSARKAGVPYIVSPCGMLDDWSMSQKALKKKTYFKLVEEKVLKNAAALHCTLQAETESKCVKHLNVPTEIVPLAVEDAFFGDMCVDRNPQQILYLGRLHYKKQPDVLIKAFIELISEKPELRLVIAGDGDGDYVDGLTKLAEAHSNNISFVGMITGSEKVKLFKESGFFALPSLQENFGITVAEAMAAGAVPVISKEVALSVIITDHQAGFVSETGLSSFQKALLSAIEEKEIGVIRSNCQEYAFKNFSQSVVGDQFFTFSQNYSVAREV